ncbi:hypothetical protein EOL73_00780 [Candidatus Saccharibacteria bacterium]|nr:hypothetical protein [Candidatus Saccharibacteria bacterium]NCU40278.1 hypothetical protein [Candidatus Saccharibacteria bacterium]
MLEIKPKINIKLPEIHFQSAPLVFSPVQDEDDELINAIVDDVTEKDDDWQLTEHPDPNELEEYWKSVESDIRSDPEWVWLNDRA